MVGVKIKKKTNGSVFSKCTFSLVVKILCLSQFSNLLAPTYGSSQTHRYTLHFIDFVNLILDLDFVSLTTLLIFGDTNRSSKWLVELG